MKDKSVTLSPAVQCILDTQQIWDSLRRANQEFEERISKRNEVKIVLK